MSQGDNERAADYLERTTDDRIAILGSNDRQFVRYVVFDLGNMVPANSRYGCLYYVLGNVGKNQGRLDESFELHEKALSHILATGDGDSISCLRAQNKVAAHMVRCGELVIAKYVVSLREFQG